jgi:zinc D-Ala-D-Ala carboxypeptidase
MTNKYILSGVNYGRDLNATVAGTKNFQYWEFVSSETAVRHLIKNIPNEAQWKSVELLCQKVLQPIRDKFGELKISSGFRNPILSALIGSSTSSNHCRGEAVDIEAVSDKVTNLMLLEFINNNLIFHELIAEFFVKDEPHGGWVHVAFRNNSKIKTLKLKDSGHNFSKVSLDYIKDIYG